MNIVNKISEYNIVWDSPSKGSSGSMPLGNGDIGINLWVEEDGDLLFYLAKSDAFDNNNRPIKFGRIRVSLKPNPFIKGKYFLQTLNLFEGEINIVTDDVTLKIWIDANNPIMHIDITGSHELLLTVKLESWRTEERKLTGMEAHCLYENATVYTDTVVDRNDSIIWFYRNKNTTVKWLEDRTFGACINAVGLSCRSSSELYTIVSNKNFNINIIPYTDQTKTTDEWLKALENKVVQLNSGSREPAYINHKIWWADFWNRSYIFALGSDDAFAVTQGYILTRFMFACAGRTEIPIQFNGSMFNVDAYDIDLTDERDFSRYNNYRLGERGLNADYRRWGGYNWWQNIRLIYWPMIMSGDYDMLLHFFKIYTKVVPDAKKALKEKMDYNDAIAFFELATADGSLYRSDLKTDYDIGDVSHIFYQVFELALMMLEYCENSGDIDYLINEVIPMADAGIRFYEQHFNKDDSGKLCLYPVNACESFWKTKNPTNEIAGLKYIITRMIDLPQLSEDQRTRWQMMYNKLPDFPIITKNGKPVLAPADEYSERMNWENPELYAVFPFRVFGIGKPDLDLAKATFENRDHKETGCWRQDAIQAALIGDTYNAKRCVVTNFTFKNLSSRFPAFWAAVSDWVPDLDGGGVAMTALQRMLMQTEGDRIMLMPAWPKNWDVDFKLNAPMQTIVEGSYINGKISKLKITPNHRLTDVIICLDEV